MSIPAKNTFFSGLQQNLDQLREQGLYKPERVLASRQGSEVMSEDGRMLINMCANNYLGLSGQQWVAQASIENTPSVTMTLWRLPASIAALSCTSRSAMSLCR